MLGERRLNGLKMQSGQRVGGWSVTLHLNYFRWISTFLLRRLSVEERDWSCILNGGSSTPMQSSWSCKPLSAYISPSESRKTVSWACSCTSLSLLWKCVMVQMESKRTQVRVLVAGLAVSLAAIAMAVAAKRIDAGRLAGVPLLTRILS